jgi:ATP-dependent RNA helicase RhlB
MAVSIFKKVKDLFAKVTGARPTPPEIPAGPPRRGEEPWHKPRRSGQPQERTPRGLRQDRQGPDRQGSDQKESVRPAPERRPRGERPESPRPERRPRGERRGRQPQESRGPRPERQPAEPRPPHERAPKQEFRRTPWNSAEFDIPLEDGKVRFHDLDLPEEVMHAIYDLGFRYCTPIQAGILSKTLSGADATGRAQTGTGKTAAFLITILNHFSKNPPPTPRPPGTPRALILAPTRELVLQIEKDARGFSKYTDVSSLAVFGGMDYQKQQRRLKEGTIDIVAATPGRLLDFKRKGDIHLGKVEILVIDEADRMLDMGFIPDVRRIIESTPMKGKRQTLFFSATLTPEVNRLAASWTRDAVEVDVTPPQEMTLSAIDQMVYITTDQEKFTLLYNLITLMKWERVMIFANRRDETQFLKDRLTARGIRCGLLSGDVSQDQRVKTLEAFRSGKLQILAATDVAARGLHIEGVSHVVNYSLPMDPQDYVHRIGRTGRAGASGTSVSFATETEAYQLPEVEKFIGRELKAVHPEPALLAELPPLAEGTVEPRKRHSGPSRGGGRAGGRPRPGGARGGRGRRA